MSAAVITYLEMTDPSRLRPKACADPRFRVLEATAKQWRLNRFLYGLVGSDWTWRDKLGWTDAQWRAYAEAAALRTFLAYYDGSVAGYFELSRGEGGVEIAYFGLAPEFIGKGFGGVLLTAAIEQAWRTGPARVWVHTCGLDHPHALANYERRGMTVYKVETPGPGINTRVQE